jgi:multiple sugar transport system permease protein
MSTREIQVEGADTVFGRAVDRLEPRRWFPAALLLPALVTLVLVGLIPFCYTIFISFHETRFIKIEGFAGLDNYREVLSSDVFWHSIGVTAVILSVAVTLELLLGLGFALLLHRGVYGGRVITPALLLPSVLAPIVVAIIWKIMLAGTWGFLTYEFFDRFGILAESSVFSVPTAALAAIIGIEVWQWTPFVMLAFFAGLQALPVTPYRAAAVDGASGWQTFRYLTLPMMLPLIGVLFILRLIDTFKLFDTVFILTGGGPLDATETISLYLYKQVFSFFEVGTAAAAAVIIFIMFFVLASIAFQLLSKRLKLF